MGEAAAEFWLLERGWTVVERQFRVGLGEIDLVARDGDTWVFLEVRLRQGHQTVSALESITPAKQRRIYRAAMLYILRHHLAGQPCRFDVLAIDEGQIEWIADAFPVPSHYTL